MIFKNAHELLKAAGLPDKIVGIFNVREKREYYILQKLLSFSMKYDGYSGGKTFYRQFKPDDEGRWDLPKIKKAVMDLHNKAKKHGIEAQKLIEEQRIAEEKDLESFEQLRKNLGVPNLYRSGSGYKCEVYFDNVEDIAIFTKISKAVGLRLCK